MHTTELTELPFTDAIAVHREDGELLGFLRADGDRRIPCTVFGYALGETMPHGDAIAHLHTHGLSCLADAWELREDDEWLNVRIIEVNPQGVTVSFADYGRADLFGERRSLAAPVGDVLRRR